MITESSWFSSLWWSSWKNVAEPEQPEKLVIGVLAVEVTSLMSKVVHLWKCLSDEALVRMREEIIDSDGVRTFVSDDDDYLAGLVCGEIIENLMYVVKAVGRLGKRCTDPIWQQFEHLFDDLVKNDIDVHGLEYRWKKMDRKVKKMDRLVAVTSSLFQELEVLSDLEQVLRRMRVSNDPNRGSMQQKVALKRMEVKNLRENSLWNRTYDYTMRLLGRSLFTIFERMKLVFQIHQVTAVLGVSDSKTGNSARSHSISASMQSAVYPSENDIPMCASILHKRSTSTLGTIFHNPGIRRSTAQSGTISGTNKACNIECTTEDELYTSFSKHSHSKSKHLAAVGPFKGCMLGAGDSPILESCAPLSSDPLMSRGFNPGIPNVAKDRNEALACSNILHANLSLFCSKRKVLNAPPSTLGAAALALHYANIIIVIEKLVLSPNLIGSDARDDLYYMLSTNLKVALRARLKSYKKLTSPASGTNYASHWSKVLKKILVLLAPLAHNFIQWQSERNFEQQHLVSYTNVLLVQTLHFADQAKTEAAITELLVGLNYICRSNKALTGKA